MHFAPSSSATFYDPSGNPRIQSWQYRNARSPPVAEGLDTLPPSPPGSPSFGLRDDIRSRSPSPGLSQIDGKESFTLNAPYTYEDPFRRTARDFHNISMNPRESRMATADIVPLPEAGTYNPALMNIVAEEVKRMSPETRARRESALLNDEDIGPEEYPDMAQRTLRFLLKDVSYTGPFYLLTANNTIYLLLTLYPPTRYSEVRANIIYNFGCVGIHYISGCWKYDVLNRKDFKKFRPITYAMLGMILGHLARAWLQYRMLAQADNRELWPADAFTELFNESNQIRFAMAGWTFIEICILEIWYSIVPVIR